MTSIHFFPALFFADGTFSAAASLTAGVAPFFSALISSLACSRRAFFTVSIIPAYTLYQSSTTYIATEFIVNTELLQTGALFLLFLQEALHTGGLFIVSAFTVLLVPELDLSRHVLPFTVAILENVFVRLVNEVAVQLFAKHNVAVHCLCGNLSDLFVCEFKESITS